MCSAPSIPAPALAGAPSAAPGRGAECACPLARQGCCGARQRRGPQARGGYEPAGAALLRLAVLVLCCSGRAAGQYSLLAPPASPVPPAAPAAQALAAAAPSAALAAATVPAGGPGSSPWWASGAAGAAAGGPGAGTAAGAAAGPVAAAAPAPRLSSVVGVVQGWPDLVRRDCMQSGQTAGRCALLRPCPCTYCVQSAHGKQCKAGSRPGAPLACRTARCAGVPCAVPTHASRQQSHQLRCHNAGTRGDVFAARQALWRSGALVRQGVCIVHPVPACRSLARSAATRLRPHGCRADASGCGCLLPQVPSACEPDVSMWA